MMVLEVIMALVVLFGVYIFVALLVNVIAGRDIMWMPWWPR